jgi:hypothetical protein
MQTRSGDRLTGGISSSSVVRLKENPETEIHSPVENCGRLAKFEGPLSEEIQRCEQIVFQEHFQKVLNKQNPESSCLTQTNTGLNQRLLQPTSKPDNQQFVTQNGQLAGKTHSQQSTQGTFSWDLRAHTLDSCRTQ